MDNLLPAVPNADIKSDEYRARSLPLQQWEVARTHHPPSTPSDVYHLLSPIQGTERVPRFDVSDSPSETPAHEARRLHIASAGPDITAQYNPALDPSPIGAEERGVARAPRISRNIPRREKTSRASSLRSTLRLAARLLNTVEVAVLNGYRSTDRTGNEQEDVEDGNGVRHDSNIDVFVHGFSPKMEHATLRPYELFRRTLRQGGWQHSPKLHVSHEVEQGAPTVAEENLSTGLTILFCGAGDWLNSNRRGAWDGVQDWEEVTSDGSNFDGITPVTSASKEDEATEWIFQNEHGLPGLPRNAFEVPFEPGPLGLELEESQYRRHVIQIRRIIQGSQAERDGRLSPGFLITAVGSRYPPFSDIERAEVPKGDAVKCGSAADPSVPRLIQSLSDFEDAVLHRDPQAKFVVWALDPFATEEVAALPDTPFSRTRPTCLEQPPQSRLAVLEDDPRTELGSNGKFNDDIIGVHDRVRPAYSGASPVFELQQRSENATGPDPFPPGSCAATSGDLCLGIELKLDAIRDREGHGHPTVEKASSAVSCEDGADSGQDETELMGKETAAEGITGRARLLSMGDNINSSEGLIRDLFHLGRDADLEQKGWEFATGEGMFMDDDQLLAARRPAIEQDVTLRSEAGNDSEKDEDEDHLQPLPLGLEASRVDDHPVFISFCNNHASAMMQVSWIDYDGHLVPRRTLAPGSYYFERSFASHPWILRCIGRHRTPTKDSKTVSCCAKAGRQLLRPPEDPVVNGDSCVIRLGEAMARTRLTGSLLWNPNRRTLSLMKQAKVGSARVYADRLARVGLESVEGAGVAPGKKGLCFAGAKREAEAARCAASRARVRAEKTKVLDEMRAWRTHPPLRNDVGADFPEGGLGMGAPNVRFVLIGTSNTVLISDQQ